MEILLWLAPAAVVTVLAMLWVGWAGRTRREPDRDVLLERLGKGLERPTALRYAAPRREPDRGTGLAVRRSRTPGS
ncbi:hypothetical protein [Nocardioides sp. GY 10127]|uniref:hypothetical protein n=1 Tax=Nocardioides sp. GY 10127 TaxID=2569762 RepID=UPI0010A8943A|nr:hypothetical protein [Nocardioides sp. GY 10127]TIC84173.1 hypothetical protein E8D37_05070 [Nocardioides sp. GY 10127]